MQYFPQTEILEIEKEYPRQTLLVHQKKHLFDSKTLFYSNFSTHRDELLFPKKAPFEHSYRNKQF